MMTYLVIGLCLFLLIVVVYISAKPISMGIEARRNIKDVNDNNTENMNKEPLISKFRVPKNLFRSSGF